METLRVFDRAPGAHGGEHMKQTQGRKLIAALKRRQMTYREMLQACESCSPWRRIAECLKPDEQLVKGKRGEWTTWRVVSATRWTA